MSQSLRPRAPFPEDDRGTRAAPRRPRGAAPHFREAGVEKPLRFVKRLKDPARDRREGLNITEPVTLPAAQIESFLGLHLHPSSQGLRQAAHGDRLVGPRGSVGPQPALPTPANVPTEPAAASGARHTPAAGGAREQDGPLPPGDPSRRGHSPSSGAPDPHSPPVSTGMMPAWETRA